VSQLRDALEEAVRRQLMSDVPYGVLLSGGLDSSVISAVAKQFASHRIETDGTKEAWWPQLHSFAIGLEGAPDLAKAREVADYIGTVHHEIHYTLQEGLDALRDVIYYIETYDVTTVRASTPMYLLARVIKSMGIKMVLSGEGADEVFGGYLYFHKAPDAKAFHEEPLYGTLIFHPSPLTPFPSEAGQWLDHTLRCFRSKHGDLYRVHRLPLFCKPVSPYFLIS
jgi:asparagine synthase (glutamine-hydrolysing)